MNALSMESVFLILSGAVLAAGILYWFWSHLQLTQKKVQLLENAVFELRGLGSTMAPAESHTQNVPEYKDDEEEEDEGADSEEWPAPPMHGGGGSTPLSALDAAPVDLQPGGRLEVPVLTPITEEETAKDVQFRELFIQHEARVPTPATPAPSSQGESLEAMPVKELRRLAEQRGLTGVSDMRKKDLLAALRSQVTLPDTAVAASPNPSTEVTVERTLDLTDDAVVLE